MRGSRAWLTVDPRGSHGTLRAIHPPIRIVGCDPCHPHAPARLGLGGSGTVPRSAQLIHAPCANHKPVPRGSPRSAQPAHYGSVCAGIAIACWRRAAGHGACANQLTWFAQHAGTTPLVPAAHAEHAPRSAHAALLMGTWCTHVRPSAFVTQQQLMLIARTAGMQHSPHAAATSEQQQQHRAAAAAAAAASSSSSSSEQQQQQRAAASSTLCADRSNFTRFLQVLKSTKT